MRTNRLNLCIAFCLVVPVADAGASPGGRGTPERIGQLITQLGSSRFREREQAATELDAIGEPALSALKKAAQDPDLEVRRRAEALATGIRKRVEMARLLQPMRVRWTFRNTPLSEAIAEISKQTGFNIELHDSPAETLSWFIGKRRSDFLPFFEEPTLRAIDPRISLDTGDTSFWNALDYFCQELELVERPGSVASDPGASIWIGQPGGVQFATPVPSVGFNRADDRLILEGGNPAIFPSCYTGAVRFRAKPAKSTFWTNQVPKGEDLLLLEVSPQPKIGWLGITDLHVEKALDANGRPVAVASGRKDTDTRPLWPAQIGNRAVLWDVDGRFLGPDMRFLPVRFKKLTTESRVLRELRGTITARIQTPLQPLITVDDVLKGVGQVVSGPNGESLKVIDLNQMDAGKVKIRVRLEDPSIAWMLLNNRFIMRGNVIRRRANFNWQGGDATGTLGDEAALTLYDTEGRPFREREERRIEFLAMGNGITPELSLVLTPPTGESKPGKLVYSNRRLVNAEIPFALTDISLR
jgi:hypothetical protein